MSEDWLRLGAFELARRLAAGEMSSLALVEHHIARIESVNVAINALVADRFAAARAEACDADRRLAAGERSPLLGVPCSIKEFVGVAGMPQTGGLAARRGVLADRDAAVTRRVRDAGAIVLGVTNAPEGGLWHETNNPVYGRTRNPHDLLRTPGGSSGGEGALIAAGGSPFGLGSDTGGSIRIPAGFCGIAGHKPTGGLVPNTGHFPHAPRVAGAPMVVGPLARSAEDLWPLLRLLAGPDGVDPSAVRALEGDPAAVDWRSVRVAALPNTGSHPPSPEVGAAVERAARILEELGATRVEPHLPRSATQAFELWAAYLSESGETYDELVSEGRGVDRFPQLLRWARGHADHTGAVLSLLFLERALHLLPGRVDELAAAAKRLPAELDAALGPTGLLIHPVYPRTAPRHRAVGLRDPRHVGCTTLFNVSESPVTVVPISRDPAGLPVGVQLAARRGNDALTIAAGVALERALGGFSPTTPRAGARLPFGLALAT